MAIATTSQVLNDGPRNAVIHLTGLSDGIEQETLITKVDVSALGQPVERVRLKRITYTLGEGIVRFLWDANTNLEFLILNGHGSGFLDYRQIGGLPNKADETATGNILMSTENFGPNSSYTITLELVKRFG